MEGIGGPVNVERFSTSGLDPTLEDCCRREVCESDVKWSGESFSV